MIKFNFAILSLTLILSAAAQAADLGTATKVLTCSPSAADANRSGLENVIVTKHVWGCNQNGNGPHCFAFGVYYTAEVTVNVPFDNFVSQTFKISAPGSQVPGRGAVYSGQGFELDMGPVVPHPVAHVRAHIKAQDGYPAQEVNEHVECK